MEEKLKLKAKSLEATKAEINKLKAEILEMKKKMQ